MWVVERGVRSHLRPGMLAPDRLHCAALGWQPPLEAASLFYFHAPSGAIAVYSPSVLCARRMRFRTFTRYGSEDTRQRSARERI